MKNEIFVTVNFDGKVISKIPGYKFGSEEIYYGRGKAVGKIMKQWISSEFNNANVTYKASFNTVDINVECSDDDAEYELVKSICSRLQSKFEQANPHYNTKKSSDNVFTTDDGKTVEIDCRFVFWNVKKNPNVAKSTKSAPKSGGRSFPRKPQGDAGSDKSKYSRDGFEPFCNGWLIQKKEIPSKNTVLYAIKPKKGIKAVGKDEWSAFKSQVYIDTGIKWSPSNYQFEKWGEWAGDQKNELCAIIGKYYSDESDEPQPKTTPQPEPKGQQQRDYIGKGKLGGEVFCILEKEAILANIIYTGPEGYPADKRNNKNGILLEPYTKATSYGVEEVGKDIPTKASVFRFNIIAEGDTFKLINKQLLEYEITITKMHESGFDYEILFVDDKVRTNSFKSYKEFFDIYEKAQELYLLEPREWKDGKMPLEVGELVLRWKGENVPQLIPAELGEFVGEVKLPIGESIKKNGYYIPEGTLVDKWVVNSLISGQEANLYRYEFIATGDTIVVAGGYHDSGYNARYYVVNIKEAENPDFCVVQLFNILDENDILTFEDLSDLSEYIEKYHVFSLIMTREDGTDLSNGNAKIPEPKKLPQPEPSEQRQKQVPPTTPEHSNQDQTQMPDNEQQDTVDAEIQKMIDTLKSLEGADSLGEKILKKNADTIKALEAELQSRGKGQPSPQNQPAPVSAPMSDDTLNKVLTSLMTLAETTGSGGMDASGVISAIKNYLDKN